MKAQKNIHIYESADIHIQKKVALKYMDDPQGAIMRIPNEDETILRDAIEIWHNGEYHLVIVNEDNLRKIHWDAYLQSSDDGIFLSYFDDENPENFTDDGFDFHYL
ncbi:MAG: hypothetical protein HUJ25_03635 [Crocinitomicaceae bacterium]|nr:hypothetical protein [Crocinitomicaceae bacterium]